MIGNKYCPKCDSEDVAPLDSGEAEIWMCNECGYSSSKFPEKGSSDYSEDGEEEFEEEDMEEEKPKKAKKVKKAKKAKKGGKKK